MHVPVVLASRSPARLATLRSAGIEPTVIVSDVDEDALLAGLHRSTDATSQSRVGLADTVLALATAKARAVATGVDALVIGCDSMLEFEGDLVGKPGSADQARSRWQRMRGGRGTLYTGHWVVDDRRDGTGEQHGATSATQVAFADLSDAEIDAYVATGEPLHVAGAFTIDGLGGPFVESLTGDPHGVVGLSLPLLRRILLRFDIAIHELWSDRIVPST